MYKSMEKNAWSMLTSLHLFGVVGHVVRSDRLQELHVIIWVIFSHFLQNCLVRSLKKRKETFWYLNAIINAFIFIQSCSSMTWQHSSITTFHKLVLCRRGPKIPSKVTYINLHLSVESIVEKQVVCHTYSVWFHRMSLAIVVVADVTYCS